MAKKDFDPFDPPNRKPRRPNKSSKISRNPDFEKQTSRTVLINNLAADLNRILEGHGEHYKVSNFYQRTQAKMRKEPLNNPFLLYRRLRGMDIHPRYPLTALGDTQITARILKKKRLEVNVMANAFANMAMRHDTNCYSYKLVLICWQYNVKKPVHFSQESEWLHYTAKDMVIDFFFDLPKDTRFFMLCLAHCQGKDNIHDPLMRCNAMRIMQVDTLDEEDAALAKERDEADIYEEMEKPKPDTRVRVKARKIEPGSDSF
ncbi:hypothetical protein [Flavihumibacter sp.]|uniref:hypothetical protein n=1 Tax=Flavihumibacter sp. TaxID=1913981 RepID=UPI002FC8BCE9